MNIENIALGLVQGLTEFIPVSSSGHLVLLGNLFHIDDNLHLFIEALDFGTLLALVIFFRKKIIDICRQVFVKHDFHLLRNLLLTSLPVAIVGFFAGSVIDQNDLFTSSLIVAIMLVIVGFIMLTLEKIPHLTHKSDGSDLSWKRALGIGFAQTLALVPGVSRSGATIIAARISGLKSKQAAEYSFLASIPVMFGLIAKLIIKDHEYLVENWQAVLVGNIFAFIAGTLAIQFLLDFLGKHTLKVFGVYRIALAIIVMILIMFGIM